MMCNMLGSTQIWDACKSAKVGQSKRMMTYSRVQKKCTEFQTIPRLTTDVNGRHWPMEVFGQQQAHLKEEMNASWASINRGFVQGHVPFWTSFFGALPIVSPPNHHVGQPNHHILHPPSLLPLQKYQGPRYNGGIFSTLCTIVAGLIFVTGVDLLAPDAPEATLCMANNSKHNANQQASDAKGWEAWERGARAGFFGSCGLSFLSSEWFLEYENI